MSCRLTPGPPRLWVLQTQRAGPGRGGAIRGDSDAVPPRGAVQLPHLHWERQNAREMSEPSCKEQIQVGVAVEAGLNGILLRGYVFLGCVWDFLCVSPLVLPFSAPAESSIEEIFESQNSRIPGAIAVCKASFLLSFIHGFTVFRTVFFLLEPAEPVLTHN